MDVESTVEDDLAGKLLLPIEMVAILLILYIFVLSRRN